MSGIQAFGTFGLPAIAISLALVGLYAAHRSAARIDAAQARAHRRRAAGG